MIKDALRLVDGFDRLPLGMDGSRDSALTPLGAVYYAENVVFRGGAGAETRPGFEMHALLSYAGSPGFLLGASRIQGAYIYRLADSLIVVVADGVPLIVDVVNKTIKPALILSGELTNSDSVYFCQVQEYLVIQDGVNPPVVLSSENGEVVQRFCSYYSSDFPAPKGRQMAYGQGRLFVASPDGRSITAGDIAFGGSTTSVKLLTSSEDDEVLLTTEKDHNFVEGDYITIAGHSSLPTINGTFQVKTTPSSKSLTVAAAIGVAGTGGVISKFNSGASRDALIFNENTFINEGGAFSIPSELGVVQSMNFLPLQDTATGQGDLIVFCTKGALSFSVTVPRTQWKETPNFQRVLFSNIGSLAETTAIINGDIFFRSREGNGLRSYRSARAEFGNFGQTPISSEMDLIFTKDDLSLLDELSMIYFDDRLLVSAMPSATGFKTTFNGLVSLDFRPAASSSQKSGAIYDGLWTGLSVVKLVSGAFAGRDRAFAICDDPIAGVSLWEITKDGITDKTFTAANRPIQSLILTKAFSFEKPWNEKKLIHADLWFSEVGGYGVSGSGTRFESFLHYRQDNNPNWESWGEWELCFSESDADALQGYAPQLRTPTINPAVINEFTGTLSHRGYDFKLRVEWHGHGKLEKLLVHALEILEPAGASFKTSPCILVKRNNVPDNLSGGLTGGGGGGGEITDKASLLLDETSNFILLLDETTTYSLELN